MPNLIRAVYNIKPLNPVYSLVGRVLKVTAHTCRWYCISGALEFGLWVFLALALIFFLIIFLIHRARKRKGKKTRLFAKIIIAFLTITLFFSLFSLTCCSLQYLKARGLRNEGNADIYNPENAPVNENSPIKGKTIFWIGSSVFYGYSAQNKSLGSYVEHMDGAKKVEALKPGATIADINERSYYHQILEHNRETDPVIDLVVIQLTTNDCKGRTVVGEVSPYYDSSTFDSNTSIGSLEAIACYAMGTWDCPTLLISSPRFTKETTMTGMQDIETYEELIEKSHELESKWDFLYFLDLWDNEEMFKDMEIGDDRHRLYMADSIHSTKLGFLEWLLPQIRPAIYSIIGD